MCVCVCVCVYVCVCTCVYVCVYCFSFIPCVDQIALLGLFQFHVSQVVVIDRKWFLLHVSKLLLTQGSINLPLFAIIELQRQWLN